MKADGSYSRHNVHQRPFKALISLVCWFNHTRCLSSMTISRIALRSCIPTVFLNVLVPLFIILFRGQLCGARLCCYRRTGSSESKWHAAHAKRFHSLRYPVLQLYYITSLCSVCQLFTTLKTKQNERKITVTYL